MNRIGTRTTGLIKRAVLAILSTRHPRVWTAVILAHIWYAVLVIAIPYHDRLVLERWVTTLGMVYTSIFYWVVAVTFYQASKQAFNQSLFVQKIYLGAYITLAALPFQLGLFVHNVPYFEAASPISLFTLPGWARTYLWLGIAVSTHVTLVLLYRANWKGQIGQRVREGRLWRWFRRDSRPSRMRSSDG